MYISVQKCFGHYVKQNGDCISILNNLFTNIAHYENMSMQYAAIFKCAENDNFLCFGFKSGICLLIAPVPVHCFSITFIDDKILIFFYYFCSKHRFWVNVRTATYEYPYTRG